MMKVGLGFMVFFVLQVSCKSTEDTKTGIPECVLEKIEEIKAEPVRNPPAEVWLWKSDGNHYYYFNAPCCDIYNKLYNSNCEYVCAPDGGMKGTGDGKCPTFSEKTEKILLYRDERKK